VQDGEENPVPVSVWTSTLKRTIQTASYLPFPKLRCARRRGVHRPSGMRACTRPRSRAGLWVGGCSGAGGGSGRARARARLPRPAAPDAGRAACTPRRWKALDEIDAGICDGMTYAGIADNYPGEFESRKRDKLRYRCARRRAQPAPPPSPPLPQPSSAAAPSPGACSTRCEPTPSHQAAAHRLGHAPAARPRTPAARGGALRLPPALTPPPLARLLTCAPCPARALQVPSWRVLSGPGAAAGASDH